MTSQSRAPARVISARRTNALVFDVFRSTNVITTRLDCEWKVNRSLLLGNSFSKQHWCISSALPTLQSSSHQDCTTQNRVISLTHALLHSERTHRWNVYLVQNNWKFSFIFSRSFLPIFFGRPLQLFCELLKVLKNGDAGPKFDYVITRCIFWQLSDR